MEIRALHLNLMVVSIINIPSRWMLGKAAIISLEQNINVPNKAHKISSKSFNRLLFWSFAFLELLCVFKFINLATFYFCGIYTFGCVCTVNVKAPVGLVFVIICGNSVYLGVKAVFTLNKLML